MKELKQMKKRGHKSWTIKNVNPLKVDKMVKKLKKKYQFVDIWEHANSKEIDILVVF